MDSTHLKADQSDQKTQQFAGNVMASVIWDTHSIISIENFETKKNNSECCKALVMRFREKSAKKKHQIKIYFHQDNSSCHNHWQ